MPLYDLGLEHIDYFFEYEGKIGLDDFIQRCYEICKNGVWDAVTYFQIKLTDLIIKYPDKFCKDA